MPNNNVTAQCPFYEKENQTTIFCETIFEEEGMDGEQMKGVITCQ